MAKNISKSQIPRISLTSPISLIVILFIIIISFFAGSYYQSSKSQENQESSVSQSQNQIPTIEKLIISRAIDGDTVVLTNGKEIRLYGISTPEFKEPYYQEAKKFTENLVLNKEIILEQEDKYKEDKFGRLLGYIIIDGKNLNIELVRNGLAKVVLYEKRAKIKYQVELLQAETQAKEKRVGMWGK